MNWRPAALLPLILTLWACAEGGSRGSGISTSVLGNVESVQTAACPRAPGAGPSGLLAELRAFIHVRFESIAHAGTGIEGIRVAVEGTGARGETDTDGNFSVHGDFEGTIRLVFQLPDGGGEAQIALNVPAGGRLTLNNVAVDAQRGEAVAETQDVDFDGTVTGVDCQGLTLTLVSTHHGPDDVDPYTLRLDTSSVRNAQGDIVACADIRVGEQAMVQGVVNPDGTFGHATVDLTD
jgi:hypothetical protein